MSPQPVIARVHTAERQESHDPGVEGVTWGKGPCSPIDQLHVRIRVLADPEPVTVPETIFGMAWLVIDELNAWRVWLWRI